MDNNTTFYKKPRKTILDQAKEYYESNKDRIRIQVRNKYTELSDEERNIKREFGRNRYHNMSEENKQRLREYQKIIAKQKIEQKRP